VLLERSRRCRTDTDVREWILWRDIQVFPGEKERSLASFGDVVSSYE